MSKDELIGSRFWLDSRAVTRTSDIALGATALAVAAFALTNIGGSPFASGERLSEWFFPSVVASLLASAGIVLMVRGAISGGAPPERWRLRDMLIIAAAVVAASLAARQWGLQLMLQMGPSDIVMFMVLQLTVAIALARASRVRAFAMALLGLLLGTVGTDLATGVARLTTGAEELVDGIGAIIPATGLVVAADGVLCCASPTLFVESYGRQVAGLGPPPVPRIVGVGLRTLAALAIAAACYFAYSLNASTWEVGMLVVFAAFGLACRIFGWNRLLLILPLVWSPLLEENIRRAMLISRGDPAIFVRRPLGGTFLLLTCTIVMMFALASAWRAMGRGTKPG
jgi:Tripartite tricarboxylate transporter TctA family